MTMGITYLHDELNGTNEVSEEFEDQVLLIFFHLIETELLSPVDDFGIGKTDTSVGLEHIFRDLDLPAGSVILLVLFFVDMAILRFELIDQCVDVLVLVIIVARLGRLIGALDRVGGIETMAVVTFLAVLLVEVTRGHVGAEVIGWSCVRRRGRLVGCFVIGHRCDRSVRELSTTDGRAGWEREGERRAACAQRLELSRVVGVVGREKRMTVAGWELL